MGSGDEHFNATALRLLQEELVQPESREPGAGRTATRAHAPAPLRLDVVEHFINALAEARTQARQDAAHDPDAAPPPADPYAVYTWWESLDIPDRHRREARDLTLYHQDLQYAILAGDHTAVRTHSCPACGCWGLFWDTSRRRAVCTYDQCLDSDGLANTWTLKSLAHHHIQQQKRLNRRAT